MRSLVVVDTETTGLWPGSSVILEVAAINVATGEELYFAPHASPEDLGKADGDAMRINRYYERGVYKNMSSPTATVEFYSQLWLMLEGNTLGGSNPRFDAAMLTAARNTLIEPWHYRLADLAAYAAGALHLPPNQLVSLEDVCKMLRVDTGTAHSALDDARATAECFRELSRRYTAGAATGVTL